MYKKKQYKYYYKKKKKIIKNKFFNIKKFNYIIYSNDIVKITPLQIEILKRSILKKIKKFGHIKTKLFFNIPNTKKPNETRMGKGKGKFIGHFGLLFPGVCIFHLKGLNHKISKNIIFYIKKKIFFKIKILYI